MAALAKLGVKCFRWTPDAGFQPVIPAVRDISRREERKIQATELRGNDTEGGESASTLDKAMA